MHNDWLDGERLLLDLPQGSPQLRGVLLYPQSYAVGMSSLATHALFTGLNDEAMRWERAFVEPARGAGGSARLCSLESRTPLREFDIVAVSSSYELDWPAIPAALAAGGVPPLRAERGRGPLVLAGGPAVSAAPLPLSALYDAAYIGEIEPALPELKRALLAATREERLERLAAVRGCFVPALHPALREGLLPRRCARDLDDFDTTSAILSPRAEFADRFLVELGRGCGRGCSFCLARRLYRPLRWRSLPRVLAAVRRGLRYTADVGLVAAAVSDYPELDELCRQLGALSPPPRLSTSSVRLESASPAFLELLARGGQHTVTFAPEAGTERLREAIGKRLAEEEIVAAVGRAVAAGLTRVRLYFMVGLPTETGDDRQAIRSLAERLLREFPPLRLRLNVGAFSPRPHTPFELEALPPLRELRNWLGQVQRSLRSLPRVEVATDSARWAAMQAALSRADERLGPALAAQRPQGFSGLVNCLEAAGLDFEGLLAAPAAEGLLPRAAEGLLPRAAEGLLPWKVVDPSCAD